MPNMEGLGRLFVDVPIASGVAVNLNLCQGVTFSCTGADTFTLTLATSFGGSYTQPSGWNPITKYYDAAATNGTAVITKVTQAASNAVVQGSAHTTWIELLGAMVPDTYTYVKCTASSAGLVRAILHDPTAARGPVNWPKVSA